MSLTSSLIVVDVRDIYLAMSKIVDGRETKCFASYTYRGKWKIVWGFDFGTAVSCLYRGFPFIEVTYIEVLLRLYVHICRISPDPISVVSQSQEVYGVFHPRKYMLSYLRLLKHLLRAREDILNLLLALCRDLLHHILRLAQVIRARSLRLPHALQLLVHGQAT